jgi:hypothetical protein
MMLRELALEDLRSLEKVTECPAIGPVLGELG